MRYTTTGRRRAVARRAMIAAPKQFAIYSVFLRLSDAAEARETLTRLVQRRVVAERLGLSQFVRFRSCGARCDTCELVSW